MPFNRKDLSSNTENMLLGKINATVCLEGRKEGAKKELSKYPPTPETQDGNGMGGVKIAEVSFWSLFRDAARLDSVDFM